jgi:hypothetical protein
VDATFLKAEMQTLLPEMKTVSYFLLHYEDKVKAKMAEVLRLWSSGK